MRSNAKFQVAGCFVLALTMCAGTTKVARAWPLEKKMQVKKPAALRNVNLIENKVYSKRSKKTLDLAIPKKGKLALPAVVVIPHLGGDRSDYRDVIVEFANKGYVAAVIDYRMPGEFQFPDPILDVQSAVRWLKAHSNKYRIDKNRMAAFGVSTGGSLAMAAGMLEAKDGIDEQGPHKGESYRVCAVISCCAPTDVKALYQFHQNSIVGIFVNSNNEKYLGGPPSKKPEQYAKASPITYARPGKNAPMLLLHGRKDNIVPISQSTQLQKKVGVRARLIELKGDHHIFKLEGDCKTAKREIDAFLTKHIGK